MTNMKEVKPGKIVTINGKTFVAFATESCNCRKCALSDYERQGYCKKVECRPTFRQDHQRIAFQEWLG